MNKKSNILKYIIYVLIIVITVLSMYLLFKNKKDTQSIFNPTSTPTPTVNSVLTLILNGEKEINVIKGKTYQDAGCVAFDSIDGDLTRRIITYNNVNINVIGRYEIKYSVTNNRGITKEEIRIINVIEDLNIETDYNPKILTNQDVTITLKLSNNLFDYIRDPEGNISHNKELIYQVSSNGIYNFIVKKTDGTTIEKNIEIKNIDKVKPTGTCQNVIDDNKTLVTVTATDNNGIKKYVYDIDNNKIEQASNTYTINKKINVVMVTIYDNAENYETITCTKVDDSWPVIGKQQYQDNPVQHYNQGLLYNKKMHYILYYPNNLDLNIKNPLIVYLHGIGEFGTNIQNTLASTSAFTYNMKTGRFQQNAVFLAPQCYSGNKKWIDCFDDLKGLIDSVIQSHNIDTNRITMTGHSLGGQATFNFIVKYPGFLAAAAPLAPSSINKDFSKMQDLKIAVFTGTEDNLFSKNQSDTDYLRQNGVNIRFYPLDKTTHSSQRKLFNETNVIDWLISQSK